MSVRSTSRASSRRDLASDDEALLPSRPTSRPVSSGGMHRSGSNSRLSLDSGDGSSEASSSRPGSRSMARSGSNTKLARGDSTSKMKRGESTLKMKKGDSFAVVLPADGILEEGLSLAVLKRIEIAKKSGKLDLASMGLTRVPLQAIDVGENARVVWLTDNQITELPRTIGHWAFVTQMKLGNNKIEAIPDEIGKCAQLQMLIMHDNHVTGIPEAITGCKPMSMFDIRNNRLTRLPVYLALLTQLTDLQVDNNPLEFPHKRVLSQGKMNVLKYLKRFTDARRTRKLDLTRVGQHEIPPEVAYIGDRLTEIDAHDLYKQGGISFPFQIGLCTNLAVCKLNPDLEILSPPVSVAKNGIKAIVEYLARFNTSQRTGELILDGLSLEDLPPELYNTRQLEPKLIKILSIADNAITGFTTALGMMQNIVELRAGRNKIRTLPASLGKLKSMKILDVCENMISEVAHQVCHIAELEDLRLRRNKIITFSDNFTEMPMLRYLDLGENLLDKIPPAVPWCIRELKTLLLDRNKLTALPKEMEKLNVLEALDLKENEIKNLPAEIAGMLKLTSLDLTNNKLKGLPDSIGKLSNLTHLLLKGNEPLKMLPTALTDIHKFRCPLVLGEPALVVLDIDWEQYQSPPAVVAKLGIAAIYDYLNMIRLSAGNSTIVFSGQELTEVPDAIFRVDNLTHLDVSDNLVKTLPERLAALECLKTLILDDNHLEALPPPVLLLTSLTFLSLLRNPLRQLPVGLGNLDALDVLDIGMPGPDLKVPPPEISRKGGSSVMAYLRRITSAKTTSRLEMARLGLLDLYPEIVDACVNVSRMSLAHNKLKDLPGWIGRCHSLRTLMLHANGLAGLPTDFSKLRNLKTLDMEGNRFEEVPAILTSLTSLTELRMSRNEVHECPLVLCALTLLTDLCMDHNRINALPNRIGRCGKLVCLSFASNELTKLPASMKELTCLTSLNLSNNRLRIIPPEAGLLPKLEYADFTGNLLESPPSQIVEAGTQAIAIFLEKVRFMMETGHVDLDDSGLLEIPLDVLSYDAINTIIVSNNFLSILSPSIGRLRHLRLLDISFNQIKKITPELGQCLGLEELYAASNQFTRLPIELANLTKLVVLDLDHETVKSPPEVVTKTSGSECIRYLKGMDSGIVHSSADFSGFSLPTIPKEVMDMVSIKTLRLSDNLLESPFPPSIVKFTRLERLSLDRNSRIRDLPKTLRLMTSLSELTLSGNEYKSIPEEVYRLTNLTHLDVSHNLLEGLGAVVGNLSRLVTLDVRNNKMWTLPWGAMIKMGHLKSLMLQSNPVSYLAASLGQLTSLTLLDLSDSSLPMLPVEIAEITSLTDLRLENVAIESPSMTVCAKGIDEILSFLHKVREARHSTFLSLTDFECDGGREVGIDHYHLGTVLQSLDLSSSRLDIVSQPVLALASLTYLNLSQNKLSKLPEALVSSYPFLEKLDASDNIMTFLPRNIGGLTSLVDLILSKNMLETLPASLGMCTRLTRLDLSDNQVTYLPREAVSLTKLSHLEMQFRFLTDLQNLGLNWNMWGQPPPDVLLQGGKVIPRFYKELITAAGMLEGKLNRGPRSTLDLSNFGLLHMPAQICEKGFFTHLATLNLENNNLYEIGSEVSKLTALQTVRLRGNPLKRLPPSLGALPYISISCDLDKIENVPDIWLNKGESGVVTYLQKAFTEISVGCIDFTESGLLRLPKDISDFLPVQELFLVDNDIDRLPAAIGSLINLRTLQVHKNRLASLPKEIQYLTMLRKFTLEDNVIRILPTELGLLTGLTDLGFLPDETFPTIPQEVISHGVEHMFSFLLRLEKARGMQRHVQPLPGLKHGDEFKVTYDGQKFSVNVPYSTDITSRERFIRYFPELSSHTRAVAVSEGFSCFSNNNVGHTLDLSDMMLDKWHLYCASGYALDAAQDNFLEAMQEKSVNPKKEDLDKPKTGLGALFDDSKPTDLGKQSKRSNVDSLPDSYSMSEFDDESVAESLHRQATQYKDPRDKVEYKLDTDGYVRAAPVIEDQGDGGGGFAMLGKLVTGGFVGLTGGLGGLMRGQEEVKKDEDEGEDEGDEEGVERKNAQMELTRETEKTAVERPLMTCDRPDPFLCIMTDPSFRECVPMTVCVASNLTTLNLDNNSLKTIASGVGNLSNLTCLSARNNKVEAISWRLRYLLFLRELNMSNNLLSKLPSKIGRCFRLQTIDVSWNQIVALPATIGRLENLKLLDCSGNLLSCLPHEIGGVDHEDHAKDIVGLKSIRSIILRSCENLSQFPSKLYRLTTLTELDVEGSDNIITPPPEVMSKGLPAVREFLNWLYDGENSDSANFVNQGLHHAPAALAEITMHVSEPQPRLELGMLSLKHLDLSSNMLRNLDPFLADLSNLRSLKVDFNRLEELPPFFKYFTRLGFLSISNNRLKTFVAETGKLLSIRTIVASNNQIDSLVDGFAHLSTLRNLDLAHNTFRTIPECLLKLSELRTLQMSNNVLKRLPKSISGLMGLHTLSVSFNELSELPNEIGEMVALSSLDLADNQIEFLPIGLGKLTNLTALDIVRNGCVRPPKGTQMKGPAAMVDYLERIAHAEKRKLLDLASFGLATFPSDVVTLISLTELNLTDNAITSVPADIVSLTRLVVLRLAKNGLKKLPAIVGSLITMETLDLHDNLLESLPSTFHKLGRIVHLDLSGNKLAIFPSELEHLTQIEHLDLTDNEMTRIPTWMGSFATTNAILLGGNMLQTIPNSIGGMGPMVLATINMSNNGLIKVPTALCSVVSLKRATFTGNKLQELPAQIGRLVSLEELWIDSNEISRLPPSLGSWISLTALYAHNNKLQAVPRAIVELEKLAVLTLSNNQITDLPWNMAVLTNLEELWLDSNKITILPQGLEDMPMLRDLTCNHNKFEGKELERAEMLMERFENEEVAHILAIKKRDALPRSAPARMPSADNMRPDVDARELERQRLEGELLAATEAGDFDAMEEIQSKLDVFEEDDAHHEAEQTGYDDLDNDEEEGAIMGVILTVSVIGCEELVPHKGTQVDSYVELLAGGTKHKTKVQRKTTAPIFEEAFTFKGTDRNGLGLSIEVKHKNMISADVLLGRCEIAPSKYPFGRDAIETISLYKTEVGMDDAGSIDLKYRLDRVK